MKRFILAILLTLCGWTHAWGTDVTLSPTTIPNFNPSNIGGNVVVSGVTVAGTALSCSACFRPTWVGLGGFTVSITGNQGPQDYIVLYVASTSSAVLATSTGLNTTTAVTFYPYVEFRVYANQAFQPLGESYVVQAGSPGTGSWYKRYAVSVVPLGAVKELRIPTITIAATTDSPGPTNQARYTAAFYRPDNSLIQFYNCFEQFAVPPTTPSTWTALCAWNSPGGVVPPAAEAYTKTQIDVRFPSCNAGQMIYYAATGNTQNCLTVGNGLAIVGGVLASSGAGGISGSGTAGYIPKFVTGTSVGNSIAREISSTFRVDGKHLVSRTATAIPSDTAAQVDFTYNPGNVTADQSQVGLQVNTTLQSGINAFITGIQSVFYDTSTSDTTATATSTLMLSSGSAGDKTYTGISSGFIDTMTGGSTSFAAFRVLPPSRGLSSNVVSHVGFLNMAPSNLSTISSYSALESTGGKFVLTKKFTADEVGLKNAMPLRLYTTTALNPAQNAWVGFALGAAPATNYTYLWPTGNVMIDKHLTIDAINGTDVSLKWAAAMEAAGSDMQVQFNDNGMLAGDSRFKYDMSTGTLSVQGPVDFLQTISATPVTFKDGKRLRMENSTATDSFTVAYNGSGTGGLTYFWPGVAPAANQVLRASAPVAGNVTLDWVTAGAGTVTSVGMSVPSTLLAVSPASITSTGTFAVTLPSRPARSVFAGPTSAPDAAPTFRSLVATDLPTLDANTTIAGPVMALGSDAAGDTYYRKASGTLTRLGIGSTGQVLTVSGGQPAWQTPATPVTLNSTTGTIPVQSNSTTLIDSPLRVASGNVELYPTSTSGRSLAIYDSTGTNRRVQLGTIPADNTYGAVYLGNVTTLGDRNMVLRSNGPLPAGAAITELNAPGANSPFLLINSGDTVLANGTIELTIGQSSVVRVTKNTLQIVPIQGDENALRVDATCSGTCTASTAAVQVTRGAVTQSAPIVMADFQAYHTTSTTLSGFGTRIRFGAEASSTMNTNLAAIDAVFTLASGTQPVSNLALSLVNTSTTYTEYARLTPTSLILRNGGTGTQNYRAILNGDADYTPGHPGSGTGLILPRGFIAGPSSGFAEGSGIWWIGSDETGYSGLNGMWLQSGMNWQGEGGNEIWKFRQPTDSSSAGSSVIEINPSVAESSISLFPYGTGSAQTTRVKFYELAANGGNFISLMAPNAIGNDVTYQLPNKPTVTGSVLTAGNPAGFEVALQWTATSGSGDLARATSPTLTTPTISGMLQLHTATWANRPTATNGGVWYCTDCQVTSGTNNTCTDGNTTGGALAVGITTTSTVAWRCFATQN